MLVRELENLAGILGTGIRVGENNAQMSCPNASSSSAHRGSDVHYSFSVSISMGRSKCYCFTCGIRGQLVYVLQKLAKQGTVPEEAYEYAMAFDRGDFTATIRRLKERPQKITRKSKPFAVDIFAKKCHAQVARVMPYLLQRGVLFSEVNKYMLGYDSKLHRLTFPIRRNNGAIVGCVGRALGTGPKYYKYPGGNDALMGEEKADSTLQEVTLVEGPFDLIRASRCLPNVLALNGSVLNTTSCERVLNIANKVTLILDGDGAGAAAVERIGQKLCRRARVYVVSLPRGKDPGNMDLHELFRRYQHERQIFHRLPNFFAVGQ